MKRILAIAGLASCAAMAMSVSMAGEESIRLKEGKGRDLTMARCVICHSLDYIPMNAPVMKRAGWEKNVRKMIDVFGAPITDEEAKEIVAYLEGYSA